MTTFIGHANEDGTRSFSATGERGTMLAFTRMIARMERLASAYADASREYTRAYVRHVARLRIAETCIVTHAHDATCDSRVRDAENVLTNANARLMRIAHAFEYMHASMNARGMMERTLCDAWTGNGTADAENYRRTWRLTRLRASGREMNARFPDVAFRVERTRARIATNGEMRAMSRRTWDTNDVMCDA